MRIAIAAILVGISCLCAACSMYEVQDRSAGSASMVYQDSSTFVRTKPAAESGKSLTASKANADDANVAASDRRTLPLTPSPRLGTGTQPSRPDGNAVAVSPPSSPGAVSGESPADAEKPAVATTARSVDRAAGSTSRASTSRVPVEKPQPQVAGMRWAVVIGVSRYADSRIPGLRFAGRDATAFHAWLTSREGGRFPPQNTVLLVDEQATGRAMKKAIEFLREKAVAEDTVVIYFAGHGTPESPDNPDALFLLPSDAEFDQVAATGFGIADLQASLSNKIRARNLLLFADACHSGGIGAEYAVARRGVDMAHEGLINQGVQSLTAKAPNFVVMTSAASNQLSREGEQWGGGHGVFTHFLLSGLRGAADFDEDKRVTLGELFPYVSEQVRRATQNKQSPEISGKPRTAMTLTP